MNLTVTPLIRIAALVGVIAIVALGGSMMMLGRSHPSTPSSAAERHGSAPASARVVHVPAKKHVDPTFAKPSKKTTAPAATQHKTVTTTTTAAKHKAAATHKVAVPATHKVATPAKHKAATPVVHKAAPATTHKTATAAKHKATTHKAAKFHGNPVYEDLPAPLQWELAHHKVVVVSFYNPHDDVDAISVAEAHAGAVKADAGFLLVNVLNDKVAGILTALLPSGGLLPQPGVIVYRAPGNIAMRMDGFSDRDSVAQAAANAFLTTAASTVSGAPAAVAAAPVAAAPVTPAVTPAP